jgi:hypothetical protein
MSIQDFADKIKGRGGKAAMPLVLLAVAGVSFWLGYSAKAETAQASPVVIQCPMEAYVQKAGTNSSTKPSEGDSVNTGSYIASKNGTKYYPPGCAGAKRIQDANRVYFINKAEAESAGYSLAATCK